MALTLNSDIVAGVLMAAPTRPGNAAATRFAAGKVVASSEPVTVPFNIEAAGNFTREMTSELSNPPGGIASQQHPGDRGRIKAFVEFESLLARTMLEPVMSVDESQVFGSGFAGSMWRSMAAEQYASLFVSAGGLGLAREMAAEYSGQEPSGGLPLGRAPSLDEVRG